MYFPPDHSPIKLQQFFYEIFRHHIEILLPLDFPVKDLLVNCVSIWCVERRLTNKHLVNQNAERPEINAFVVPSILDDFWS